MFTEFTLILTLFFSSPPSIFLFAGRPQPQVRWLVNGVLVDDQYEHNTGDVIENRLLWPAVQRSDLNAIFTCQAVNTILVEPKENSYVLDLHRKYSTIFFFFKTFSVIYSIFKLFISVEDHFFLAWKRKFEIFLLEFSYISIWFTILLLI